jgi:hypothetical protein
MRTRILLGGIAAALALSVMPAAQAAPAIQCAEGFEAVCFVICLVERPCT